jgi:short-subunit dehydrogenase
MTNGHSVAIITGASRGIGEAIANALAEDGFNLAICARSGSEIEATRKSILARNPDVHIVCAALDVQDGAKVQEFVQEASSLGPIEILVNNAGLYTHGTSTISSDAFRNMLETNTIAPHLFVQSVIESMKSRRRGYIFNIASICGKETYPDVGAYCASKFALVGYSSALDQEVARFGVKVTALCPSWVNTALAKNSPVPPEERIQPVDLAKTLRYLMTLSPGARVREVTIHCS